LIFANSFFEKKIRYRKRPCANAWIKVEEEFHMPKLSHDYVK